MTTSMKSLLRGDIRFAERALRGVETDYRRKLLTTGEARKARTKWTALIAALTDRLNGKNVDLSKFGWANV